ncbi:Elongator complex protein 1 [Cyphellophora attinorum]|uniref:Elongator complex protein 1 n=1 Tax=Cyphellophora attinorum TaxID=1664694 RepID=A0A0N0NQH8_9EURO|nr:Elongator complex protein 1 [Phialophora attinorum]KPI43719.1 Elongator complex protein 1 [Phialophora attinorum]
MRNLRNIGFDSVQLPDGLPLTAKAWDTTTNAAICSFGPTADRPIIELRRRQPHTAAFETIASWDAPCPLPELECDEVLLLHHFSGTAVTCLLLAGGDIVVVREQPTEDQERIEIVGSVDVGIAAAAWAADEEVLAIVTRGDTLVLMSRGFEPVTERTLYSEDLKASKHVSVGWGKKETQFQGKRAKALKDPTLPETVDDGKPSPNDDGRVTISWRGDGQFFAVNSVVPGHRRAIRVFSREAALDSASEPVDGLESALSWRPYGNLIAGIKRSQDKAEVVFFERNGLRHGQFDLRLSSIELDTWQSPSACTGTETHRC